MTTVHGDSTDLTPSEAEESEASAAGARTDSAESTVVEPEHTQAAESPPDPDAVDAAAAAGTADPPLEGGPVPGDGDAADLSDVGVDAGDDPSDLSVVVLVPAYNEADTVADVVRAAKPYADDVVVVDDASDDDTGSVAREVADGVVTHPTNLGVGAALHTGYRLPLRKEYDVVVQLDGDGQHDPSHIPEMVARLTETGAGMVVGSRWLNSSHKEYPPLRRAGIRFFTLEANLLGGVDVTDITSGYRVYDASLLAELGRPANGHWALEQTLEVARNGHDIEEVSVRMPPDSEGSQFDLETYAKYPARMVLTTLKVLLFR